MQARAALSNGDVMIAVLKLESEKLRRALYGTKSERKARLLEQLELQLEELEATATQDELAAERVAAPAKAVGTTGRRRLAIGLEPVAPSMARSRRGSSPAGSVPPSLAVWGGTAPAAG